MTTRVAVRGSQGRLVRVDPRATEGAQLAVNLYDSDGKLIAPEDILNKYLTVHGVPLSDIIDKDGTIIAEALRADRMISGQINQWVKKLQDGLITSDSILNGAIGTLAIAAGSITTALLANLAIISSKLADGAVEQAKLALAAVGVQQLADAAVIASKLAASAVTANAIATAAVEADKLAAGAVQFGKFAVGIEPVGVVNGLPVPAGYVGPKTVLNTVDLKLYRYDPVNVLWTVATDGADITANTITTNKIVAGAITTALLAANAVTTPNIAAGAVVTNSIAANAIVAGLIAAGAITSPAIAAGAVTAGKIAAGAVVASNINVGQLSAIVANLGLITAGIMTDNAVTPHFTIDLTNQIIQVKDTNGITRLLAGQVAAGVYDVQIADATGNLLFSAAGITANGAIIQLGGGRSTTAIISSVDNKTNFRAQKGAAGAVTLDLGTYWGPAQGAGYYSGRFAYQKMDVFIDFKVCGDWGSVTTKVDVQYDGGAWQNIYSFATDCDYRGGATGALIYTTKSTAWGTLAIRCTTDGNTQSASGRVTVPNFVQSGNAADSVHNTTGDSTDPGVVRTIEDIADGPNRIAFTNPQLGRLNGFQCIKNPDFALGLPPYVAYDNYASGSVAISLVADAAAPNSSGTALQIVTSAGPAPSPGLGGFYYPLAKSLAGILPDQFHPGDRNIVTVIANIPVGYTLNFANNSLGTGGSATWKTPQAGTGAYAAYTLLVLTGTDAYQLPTFPYFYLTGAAAPVIWKVAQLTCTDIDQTPRFGVSKIDNNQLALIDATQAGHSGAWNFDTRVAEGTTFNRSRAAGMVGGYIKKVSQDGSSLYPAKGTGDSQQLNLDSEIVEAPTPTYRRVGSGYSDASGRIVTVWDDVTGVTRSGGYVGEGARRAQGALDNTFTFTPGLDKVPETAGGVYQRWKLSQQIATQQNKSVAHITDPTFTSVADFWSNVGSASAGVFTLPAMTANQGFGPGAYNTDGRGNHCQIKVQPGDVVVMQISCSAAATGTVSTAFAALFVNSAGTNLGVYAVAYAGAAGTTTIDTAVLAPANAVGMRIYFQGSSGASGGNNASVYNPVVRINHETLVDSGGVRLGDQRNTPSSLSRNLGIVRSATALTATSAGAVSVNAHNIQLGAALISYNAVSNAVTGLTVGQQYYIYTHDNYAGGTQTYLSTQSSLTVNSYDDAYNAGFVTIPSSGSSGGGGIGPCIQADMWLRPGLTARDLATRWRLWKPWFWFIEGEDGWHFVRRRPRIVKNLCCLLTVADGSTLVCSSATPVNTQSGESVLAPMIYGHGIWTDSGWQRVIEVELLNGEREVVRINVGGHTILAGQNPYHRISTHNNFKP